VSEAPHDTTEQALARARRHGLAAAAEAAAAVQALLDAALLAGEDTAQGGLAALREALEGLRRRLDSDGGFDGGAIFNRLTATLDEEIRRWERKSREDESGRAVLRALLALRELLWELRSRRESRRADSPPPMRPQRVPVED